MDAENERWRHRGLKMNGGGIVDNEVGTGKTLTMCVASYEMKRLGLAHKPMIIGLKANVREIAETYRKAYPNARILYASEKDFAAANRVRFFNDIKNNDWDCVIMSHDQFGKIPQSPELQQRILQEELDTVEENLEVLRQQGKDVSRAMLRGLEKRKINLQGRTMWRTSSRWASTTCSSTRATSSRMPHLPPVMTVWRGWATPREARRR